MGAAQGAHSDARAPVDCRVLAEVEVELLQHELGVAGEGGVAVLSRIRDEPPQQLDRQGVVAVKRGEACKQQTATILCGSDTGRWVVKLAHLRHRLACATVSPTFWHAQQTPCRHSQTTLALNRIADTGVLFAQLVGLTPETYFAASNMLSPQRTVRT